MAGPDPAGEVQLSIDSGARPSIVPASLSLSSKHIMEGIHVARAPGVMVFHQGKRSPTAARARLPLIQP